jgi:hypothetical protein
MDALDELRVYKQSLTGLWPLVFRWLLEHSFVTLKLGCWYGTDHDRHLLGS